MEERCSVLVEVRQSVPPGHGQAEDQFPLCCLYAVLLWAGEPTSLVLDWLSSLWREELACLMSY